MGFHYEIHPDHVHMICEGAADIDGFLAIVSEIDRDPIFQPGLPLLIQDLKSDFNLNPTQTRHLARIFDEVRGRFAGRIAVVVMKNFHLGIGRAMEVLTEPMDVSVRVFRRLLDAQEWLGVERDAGSSSA